MQSGDAADGVVGVQGAEDEMAGHGRADGDIGRLDVANFSDHDDVWVLTQNVTQAFGKGEVDLRFHIDLRDARKTVLDRFLDRDDAALDGVDAAEKTIERSRFAGAGRAGNEDDSVRLGEERLHDPRVLPAEVETLETECMLLIATEQTQADRLAVHGRDGGNADVDGLLGGLEVDAAVLGQAALRDVHVRHHFQARDDGRLQEAQLRRDRDFVQDAIDAVTNAQIVFERLDVDVGRAFVNRFTDDLVNEFHDRCVGIVSVQVRARFDVLKRFEGAVGLENFVERFRADAVECFHCAQDLGARHEDPLSRLVEQLRGELAPGRVK